MNRKILLTDLVNRKILFDGFADCSRLDSGGLMVPMSDGVDEMVWKILKKGLVIENTAPASRTLLRLYEGGKGSASVLTEYGELSLPVEGVQIEKQEDGEFTEIHLKYRLGEEDGLFEFALRVESARTSDQEDGSNHTENPQKIFVQID